MSTQVVFLALGATRRRAVVEESAQVVADGGDAVVVVAKLRAWRNESFAPQVRVEELASLELLHPPFLAAQRIMYHAPRRAFGALGRGRLKSFSEKAGQAYEQKVARRVHNRLVAPALRRFTQDVRHEVLHRFVLRHSSFDLMVVSDPASVPVAARLVADGLTEVPVSYGLVDLPLSTVSGKADADQS
ncbi:hypothetical protein [Micromonospora eburnea]|uniref:Uncharacterized protein n=1 Tax=Micromonospora eburnea TaxID=227316 RepID=A0A1C6U422_9ACTN|nr:hypothetical protein [Micromonospora eburnea]SCL48619.1 hypothetical protein GA0070604_1739 [Micromonospora eburnea]